MHCRPRASGEPAFNLEKAVEPQNTENTERKKIAASFRVLTEKVNKAGSTTDGNFVLLCASLVRFSASKSSQEISVREFQQHRLMIRCLSGVINRDPANAGRQILGDEHEVAAKWRLGPTVFIYTRSR